MQGVVKLLILAALKLKENKPVAAAKLMGEASQIPSFEKQAKGILRLMSSAESKDSGSSVSLVDGTSLAEKDFSSYKQLPKVLDGYEKSLSEEELGIEDPYSLTASSKEDFEEGECEESKAEDEHDVDADDQEPYAVGGDTELTDDVEPERVKASFALELMRISAAAKSKAARRKKRLSDSARNGKKIKLTPRDA